MSRCTAPDLLCRGVCPRAPDRARHRRSTPGDQADEPSCTRLSRSHGLERLPVARSPWRSRRSHRRMTCRRSARRTHAPSASRASLRRCHCQVRGLPMIARKIGGIARRSPRRPALLPPRRPALQAQSNLLTSCSAIGAAYGTSKAGIGISGVGTMKCVDRRAAFPRRARCRHGDPSSGRLRTR